MINGLNPSMNFNPSDAENIPVKLDTTNPERVVELAKKCVERRKSQFRLTEVSSEFTPNELVSHSFDLEYFEKKTSEIEIISGLIDKMIFDEYEIAQSTRDKTYESVHQNLATYPHITNAGPLETDEHEFLDKIPTKQLSDDEYEKLVNKVDELKNNDLREISEEVEISPYTISIVRHEHNLYTRDEKREAAGRLLSYYLGCAMDRWELDGLEPDDDGIITFDSDSENNVMNYVRRCIELSYGENELYEKETEIEEMLNKSIEDWLRNTFFRYHHCKEYRRRGQRIPIYWQLESDESAFSCFVYYHKMDADTLHKLRGQYIDKKLDTLQNRLEAIESELETADGDRARDLRSEKEEIQADIDDITEFRNRVDALIEEGFEPDFEAGIWENLQRVDEHDLLAVPLDKL
jgi:hypothetical protein